MPVSLKKQRAQEEELLALGISMSDFEIKSLCASGSGGQKINKTSSAIFLKHLPTGITVKCSEDRSQVINRFLAIRSFIELYRKQILGEVTASDLRMEKIRKQKKRRSRRQQKKDGEKA